MYRRQLRISRKGQQGTTLIESLVAVFVLSIGMLGLAGMQANSIKYNHSALLKTIAIEQAYNLADRMRANRRGVVMGAYHYPQEVITDACFTTAGCTYTQMAQSDFAVWMDDNESVLPGGTGQVCVDSDPTDATDCDGDAATNGVSHVVTVGWSEYGESKTFTLPVRLSQP